MKTKTIFILCLLSGFGLNQLYAQQSSKQGEFTMLGEPSPLQDKMNGKVQKVILKFYWGIGAGENIKKGKAITTRERDSLNWFYDFDATFDSSGDHMMSFNHLDDNNKAITKYQFIKDKSRIVLSKWSLGKDYNWGYGNYTKGDGYTKYTYNEKGQLISKADYSSGGDLLLYSFNFKNNEAGDPIETQTLDSHGNLLSKGTSIYNEKRQEIGGDWTEKDGIIAGTYKISYNDKGKVSEMTNFDKDKKVTGSYKFNYPEYDAKGNWLKFVFKDSNGHTVLCERTITYFQ
jgi:hypothetical protein